MASYTEKKKRNEERKGFIIKALKWLLNNIFSILALIPNIILMCSSVYHYIKKNLNLASLILIIASTVFFASFIIFKIKQKNSYKSYSYPRKKIRPRFEVIKKEISYIKTKDDKLIFKRKMHILSKIDSLKTISDRYIWTGKSDVVLPKEGKSIEEIIPHPNKKGVWKFYDIELSRCIDKGEEIEIDYKWPKISNCSSSSPFVSMSTEEPTKLLVFHINLGKEYRGRKVILEEFRSIDGSYLLRTEEHEFDNAGKVNIPVPPKRFRYYIARWNWIERKGNNGNQGAVSN